MRGGHKCECGAYAPSVAVPSEEIEAREEVVGRGEEGGPGLSLEFELGLLTALFGEARALGGLEAEALLALTPLLLAPRFLLRAHGTPEQGVGEQNAGWSETREREEAMVRKHTAAQRG